VHIANNAAKHCILEGRKILTEADLEFALAEVYERQ
jgi:histone H3/H4